MRQFCLLSFVAIIAFPVLGKARSSVAPVAGSPSDFETEYSHVLDAYFEHARGVSETAIILRVWGGLAPEYEIVLDPEADPKSLMIWSATKSIWGNAYSLSQTKLGVEEYIAAAYKIKASKKEIPVPEERVRDLWRQALAIDTSTSESGPFRDSKGHTIVMADAPYFEMITHAGQVRVRVTDTSGSDVISNNPTLLRWAVEIRRTAAGP